MSEFFVSSHSWEGYVDEHCSTKVYVKSNAVFIVEDRMSYTIREYIKKIMMEEKDGN